MQAAAECGKVQAATEGNAMRIAEVREAHAELRAQTEVNSDRLAVVDRRAPPSQY